MVQRSGTAVVTQSRAQTVRQRGTEATRKLREMLGLSTSTSDTTLLSTALAEAAARSPQFASEVRKVYDELVAIQGQSSRYGQSKAQLLEPLVPLRYTGVDPDPYSAPNPQTLIYVYGANKLGRALQDYTLEMLKQTSAKIEAAHPGTKPRSKANKQSVIDYIVQYARLSD